MYDIFFFEKKSFMIRSLYIREKREWCRLSWFTESFFKCPENLKATVKFHKKYYIFQGFLKKIKKQKKNKERKTKWNKKLSNWSLLLKII